MAVVTLQASQYDVDTSLGSPRNTSFNVGTGSDRLLMVHVAVNGSVDALTVASCTYGGQNLTQLGSTLTDPTGARNYILYLIAPPTGSNTLHLVYSPSGSNARTTLAAAWNGAHQTTPLGTLKTATGASATALVSSIGATGEELVFDFMMSDTSSGWTKHASQTFFSQNTTQKAVFSSTKQAASAMQWDQGGAGGNWGIMAYAIKPIDTAVVEGLAGSGHIIRLPRRKWSF
jgi:hypothetical protein